MKPITAASSREEVLAAADAQERLIAGLLAESKYAVQDRTVCYFGPSEEDPVLARQRVAGEEDQSVPGWDFGA